MKNLPLFLLGTICLLLSTASVAQRATGAAPKGRTLPKSVIAVNVAPVAPVRTAEIVAAPLEIKDFTGVVVNAEGKPLAGAVVSIASDKSQASITTTNADGEYLLHSTASAPLLLVSYAGYVEIQQQATYARPITFQLEPIANYERELKKKSKAAGKAWRN
ncbi:MAG: carboxypeptidase regulatory-like domain-containing protein [Hymenobacter sp.]|nr:carboxypeptidase regulatory-like domain-containing protein [Hymenobacter sp.]